MATLGALALSVLSGCGGASRGGAAGSTRTSPPALTAPAGATLTEGTPAPGFVPATASFPTAQVGYAWGVTPCPKDRSLFCPGLAATTNAGASWAARTPPEGLPTDPYQRPVLRFAGSTVGWAALGGLQATYDGAETWHPVPLPGLRSPRVSAIAVSGNQVYVVADDTAPGTAATTASLALFVSNIYAETFTRIPGVEAEGGSTDVSLSFAPDGRGYIAFTAVGEPSRLLATAGDGIWRTRNLPCSDDAALHVVAAPDAEVALICDGPPATGGAPKSAWRSADGGLEFTQVAAPPGTGFTTGVAQVPQPVMPSPSSSAAPGGGPSPPSLVLTASARSDVISLSENGGRTWVPAFASSGDGSGSGLGLADLSFSDPAHGTVILGDAGLYARDREAGRHLVPGPRLLQTADGGRHWAQTVVTE